MLDFYKIIDYKSYFFLFIHLLIHFIKIKTNRIIITTLNNYGDLTVNNYNDNFYGFIWIILLWNITNIILNLLNRYTNYKIKTFLISSINKNIYLKSLENEKNNDEKHSLQLFDNSLVLDKIFERLLFTIPKILIYVFYYLYCLFNFSYLVLIITFLFNLVGIYIIKKINNLKKEIFAKNYEIDVDIKNEHIEFIKNKDTTKLKIITNLYDIRNVNKQKELFYIHANTLSTDFFTDILMCLVFCIGFNHMMPNLESSIKPIELMYMGMNSSNFMNYIIDLIENYNNHKQDLIQIGNLKKYINIKDHDE